MLLYHENNGLLKMLKSNEESRKAKLICVMIGIASTPNLETQNRRETFTTWGRCLASQFDTYCFPFSPFVIGYSEY